VTVAERSGKEPPLELSPLAKNHYFHSINLIPDAKPNSAELSWAETSPLFS
jgi:hypothetical protein